MIHYELEIQANHKWQEIKDDSGNPIPYADAKAAFANKQTLEGHGDRIQVIQVCRLPDSALERRTVIESLSMVQVYEKRS